MAVLVVWATPNDNGLTAACKNYAEMGIKDAGKEAVSVKLNAMNIERCNVCGNGFGICNNGESKCCKEDDFARVQRLHREAEAVIVITPVYWGEMSEPAKAFYDRLRRCEAKTDNINGKKCIVIAAAGGSGNGAVNCLEQMDRTMKNIGFDVVDRLPVIRFSRDYMLEAIKCASRKLAECN